MSVYVDHLTYYGGTGFWSKKKSCHMYADSLKELHDMAKKIGMKLSWFQDHNYLPHYDLVESRRKKAVQFGAVEHTRYELIEFIRRTRLKMKDLK